jgi:hypothetical protein
MKVFAQNKNFVLLLQKIVYLHVYEPHLDFWVKNLEITRI